MSIIVGNRIYTDIKRADRDLIEKFRGIPSSNIGDMMNRLYCMDGSIKAYTDKWLLGPAFTVKVPEGDNVFLHLAMELAQPGDIIVVDGAGCTTRSLMGEMMFTYSQAKGIGGYVINGAIRDVDSLEHLNMPVYAKAVTPQGPLKNGPGEINVPVCCGGQVVMPGDILVGDGDGICVIRKEEAATVYEAARKKMEKEQVTLEKYRSGNIQKDGHASSYMEIAAKLGTYFDIDLAPAAAGK